MQKYHKMSRLHNVLHYLPCKNLITKGGKVESALAFFLQAFQNHFAKKERGFLSCFSRVRRLFFLAIHYVKNIILLRKLFCVGISHFLKFWAFWGGLETFQLRHPIKVLAVSWDRYIIVLLYYWYLFKYWPLW